MSTYANTHFTLKKIVAKLHVLMDSWSGIILKEKSLSNLIWFQGAAAMLNEALAEFQEMLGTGEEAKDEESSVAGGVHHEMSPAEPTSE